MTTSATTEQRLSAEQLFSVADAATALVKALHALNAADVARLAWENEYGVVELGEQPGAYLLTRQALEQAIAQMITGTHLQQRFLNQMINDGADDVLRYLRDWDQIGPRHWHVDTASSDCDGPRYSSYLTLVDPHDSDEENVTVTHRADGSVVVESHTPHDEGYRSYEARLCYETCDLDERSQRDVFAEQMGY